MKTFYKNSFQRLLLVVAVGLFESLTMSIGATVWQRVTNWDQLSSGDYVILVNTGSDGTAYALTSTKSSNVYSTTSVTITSGKITTDAAWELKIKFNNNKIYCAFCTSEDAYNSKWLADDGTKNHLIEYTYDSKTFSGVTDITGGSNKKWCWKVGTIESSSKNYKCTLLNATENNRALQAYTSSSSKVFASHDYTSGTPAECAIFKKASEEVTVTFLPNGGLGSNKTQKIEKNKATALTAYSTSWSTKDCKRFKEWNTNQYGTGTRYTDKQLVTLSSDLPLYAIWEDDTYLISMAANPGTGGNKAEISDDMENYSSSKSLSCGDDYVIKATAGSGYYFEQWAVTRGSATIDDQYADESFFKVTGSTATVQATFKPYLHVTYDANGGTGAPSDATGYRSGETVIISSTEPTRSGYCFTGWATNRDAEEAGVTDKFEIKTNTTLYAVWNKDIVNQDFVVNDPIIEWGGSTWTATISWEELNEVLVYYTYALYNVTDGAYKTAANELDSYAPQTETGLITGKTYRIEVQIKNLCGKSNKVTKEFTVDCPAFTGDLEISISNLEETKATVSWGGVTTPTTGGISSTVNYEVSIKQKDNNAEKYTQNNTTTSTSLTTLTKNKTYIVNVTASNDCGTESTIVKEFTTKAYTDYRFTCSDLAWSTPDGTDPIWLTTRAGQVVRSQHKLHIDGSSLKPSTPLTFTIGGTAANICSSDIFAIRNKDYSVVETDASGNIDTDVYLFYNPTATTDGLDLNAVGTDIVATVAGGKVGERLYKSMSATLSTVAINGRHVPERVAVLAKMGSLWYALPANLSGTGNPEALMVGVDNNANPTIAYTAADNAYSIYSLGTTSSVASGGVATTKFKSDGDRIKLALKDNAPLFGSSSDTKIGKSTATNVVNDLDAGYQWLLTQTSLSATSIGEITYSLQTVNKATENLLKLWNGAWGLYAAGVESLRLVPIEEVKDLDLTVMEWGTNEIAVRYAGTGSLTSVKIDGLAVSSPTMTALSGNDIKLIGGLGDLTAKAAGLQCKQMMINITEGDGVHQKALNIPFILTSSKSNADLRALTGAALVGDQDDVTRNTDVVVRNGGQLTTVSNVGVFSNLYIYPGGKVEINNDISIQNVYLRGGFSWLETDKEDFRLPQLKVADGKKIEGIGNSGNGVYYDAYLDYEKFHMLALPKSVALSAVTNEENGDEFSARIKSYDGSLRAGSNPMANCWVALGGGSTVERGVGYEIAVKPRNGRNIGILRFPLSKSSGWHDEENCAPSVTAHGMTSGNLNDGVTANNAGWNLMGNPFFSAFTASSTGLIIDSLTHHISQTTGMWDGTYDWLPAEKVKYFTIPNKNDYDYTDARAASYKLEAFWPFFIQASTTGNLTFAAASRVLRAPAKIQQTNREIVFDFILENSEGTRDIAGLNISDEYADQFDMDDKEKTIENGTQYMKVYTLVDGYHLAFNSLTEKRASQVVPVGYIAPQKGTYVFTLPQDIDFTDIDAIYLTDYQEGMTTNLLYSDYDFASDRGQFNQRFALNVVLRAPQIITDLGSTETGGILDIRVFADNQTIVLTGAPMGAQVFVYDMVGKLIASGSSEGLRTQIGVPTGTYNVRVISNEGNVTIKTVVK